MGGMAAMGEQLYKNSLLKEKMMPNIWHSKIAVSCYQFGWSLNTPWYTDTSYTIRLRLIHQTLETLYLSYQIFSENAHLSSIVMLHRSSHKIFIPFFRHKHEIIICKLFLEKETQIILCIPSWELSQKSLYLNHFWVVDFPVPKVGYGIGP